MVFPNEFPALREKETIILKRFFASGKAPNGEWKINFHFPLGEEKSASLTEETRASFRALYEKRIEALGETPSEIWIVEVKETLNSLALGQLLNYRDLYRKNFPSEKAIVLACVAEADDADVRPTLEKNGIRIFLV